MYEYIKAYRNILFTENNNKKVIKIIQKWKKNYIQDAKDKHKVEKSLNNIIKSVQSDNDNMDIMDNITENIIQIGKQYDSTKDEKALDELGNILSLL